jgi:aspartate-semialdehyde dehydrogenase
MGLRVAVIGATGAVGRQMLSDLAHSGVKTESVRAFCSGRSAGEKLTYHGRQIVAEVYSAEALRGTHVALMSAGGAFSREESPKLAAMGVLVIDNSSAWRMDPKVPLVVPEVNLAAMGKIEGGGIVANPNCSTIQLVVALEPLRRAFGIELVQVASYQSCSGAGQKGIEELWEQTKDVVAGRAPEAKKFAHPIAFNLIPAIDRTDAAGHCYEEEKVVRETRKILGMPALDVMATTVRVPTLRCHGEAVTARLAREVTREELLAAWRGAEGVVLDEGTDYPTMPTPRDVSGLATTHVSRVRLPLDQARSRWAQMWVVADNLKKGAATNAVQILRHWAEQRGGG